MSKIIISGDEHTRDKQPFYDAKVEYFDWFIVQDFNNEENILINTGDFFHSKNPSPDEYSLAYYFLSKLKFKAIYILAGNGAHETNASKRMYAISPLERIKNVHTIYHPDIVKDTDLNILLLPHIAPWELNGKTLQEWYTEYIDSLTHKEWDYIVGHFFHKDGFGDEVDISKLKGKRRMGHNHVPSKDGEYVGINTITRSDEAGTKPYLNIIDTETKQEEQYNIPIFVDYYTLDYEKDNIVPQVEAQYPIFNITNALSEQAVYQKYGDIYVNRWEKPDNKLEENESEEVDDSTNKTLIEYYDSFTEKNKKLNKKLKDKLRELVKEKTA